MFPSCRVLHWVRHDAPIIIHLNLDNTLHNLLEDTHYRNLFEVHHSGGSTDFGGRRSWEVSKYTQQRC